MAKRKKIILTAIVLALFIGATIGLFFGIKDELQSSIASAGKWAWFIYIILRIILQVLLTFVPAKNVLFDAIAITLFGAGFKTFIICFISIVGGSFILDLIGRYGGSKLIIKLVGQEDYDKASKLVQDHGYVYIPAMYLLPIFPDDAICMMAGASKIRFGLHTIFIILGRGIATATIVLGSSILPPIDSLWIFVLEATVIAFWAILLFKVARWFDRRLSKKKNVKQNESLQNEDGK